MELGVLAGPGPFVHDQQNKPSIRVPCVSGDFPKARSGGCLCMPCLHASPAPGCCPRHGAAITGLGALPRVCHCRFQLLCTSHRQCLPRTGLQSEHSSSPLSFLLHFSTLPLWPLHPVPETLTEFRWLFGTAECPSEKANIKGIRDSLISLSGPWSPPPTSPRQITTHHLGIGCDFFLNIGRLS